MENTTARGERARKDSPSPTLYTTIVETSPTSIPVSIRGRGWLEKFWRCTGGKNTMTSPVTATWDRHRVNAIPLEK